MTISLSDLKAKRAAMGPAQSDNREDEPCVDDVHKHGYDGWPDGSVTRRAREVDQCEWCGWTEVEREAREAGIVATHNAADVLIAVCEAALAYEQARKDAAVVRFAFRNSTIDEDSRKIEAHDKDELRCMYAYQAAIAKITP